MDNASPRVLGIFRAPRLQTYAYLLVAIYAGLLTVGYIAGTWVVDRAGVPVYTDFATIWVAGVEALHRQVAMLYDMADYVRIQAALLGPEFAVTDLSAALRRPAGLLALSVQEAVTAGIVEPVGLRLRFRHGLLRQALHDRVFPHAGFAYQDRIVPGAASGGGAGAAADRGDRASGEAGLRRGGAQDRLCGRVRDDGGDAGIPAAGRARGRAGPAGRRERACAGRRRPRRACARTLDRPCSRAPGSSPPLAVPSPSDASAGRAPSASAAGAAPAA